MLPQQPNEIGAGEDFVSGSSTLRESLTRKNTIAWRLLARGVNYT